MEAYFPKAGTYAISHTTPDRTYRLGEVKVGSARSGKDYSKEFGTLATDSGMASEAAKLEPYYTKKADKDIALSLSSDGMGKMGSAMP